MLSRPAEKLELGLNVRRLRGCIIRKLNERMQSDQKIQELSVPLSLLLHLHASSYTICAEIFGDTFDASTFRLNS